MIILSSFFKKPEGIPAFSVARWQPKNFHLAELRFLAPMDRYGKKLTGFISPKEYRKLYKAVLMDRKEAVLNWLDSLRRDKDIVLCCWCTIEQARRRGHSAVLCHRLLLGFVIQKHRPDIYVFVDDDLYNHSIWKHPFRRFDPVWYNRRNKKS